MSNNSEKKLAKSPNRYTFSKEKYAERQAKKGLTPENDEDTAAMFEYYDKVIEQHKNKDQDESWKKDNLEYDLRSTDWVGEKVKKDDVYAQNLYAAMCNNQFQKLEVVPILTEKLWHCSWRYAGGIIADMREEGDYIDWYCSGIRENYEGETTERNYVSESTVTDEIRADLKQLGWIVVPYDDDVS